jgi:hypothetical protein
MPASAIAAAPRMGPADFERRSPADDLPKLFTTKTGVGWGAVAGAGALAIGGVSGRSYSHGDGREPRATSSKPNRKGPPPVGTGGSPCFVAPLWFDAGPTLRRTVLQGELVATRFAGADHPAILHLGHIDPSSLKQHMVDRSQDRDAF